MNETNGARSYHAGPFGLRFVGACRTTWRALWSCSSVCSGVRRLRVAQRTDAFEQVSHVQASKLAPKSYALAPATDEPFWAYAASLRVPSQATQTPQREPQGCGSSVGSDDPLLL